MFFLFCYRRTTTSSCTFEYVIMKKKKDQHKPPLVTKAKRWRIVMIDNPPDNPPKRIILFLFMEKNALKNCFFVVLTPVVVQESKVGSIYIAKYIINFTSSWRNIIWIGTFFPIYLSVKCRFRRQFTEKNHSCSEAKHMKKLEKNL